MKESVRCPKKLSPACFSIVLITTTLPASLQSRATTLIPLETPLFSMLQSQSIQSTTDSPLHFHYCHVMPGLSITHARLLLLPLNSSPFISSYAQPSKLSSNIIILTLFIVQELNQVPSNYFSFKTLSLAFNS